MSGQQPLVEARQAPDAPAGLVEGQELVEAPARAPAVQRAVDRQAAVMRRWRAEQEALPPGVVLYDGPGRLDGQPVIAVAVNLATPGNNAKTGDMVAVYIMHRNVHPVHAARTGADRAVCGTCPHRPVAGGSCYVNLGFAPAAVYRAFHAGKYPTGTAEQLQGALVRIGAYGDPAAAPLGIWRAVVDAARGHTAYSHLWRQLNTDWSAWCMASVDTLDEQLQAQRAGWRTYRVIGRQAPPPATGRRCPSPALGLTCSACGQCDGAGRGPGRSSIWIREHGARRGLSPAQQGLLPAEPLRRVALPVEQLDLL